MGEPNLGGGGGASPAIQVDGNCYWSGLNNVRILNANVAIATPGPCELFTFTHCHFVNCGVVYSSTDWHGVYTEFDNCLMTNVGTVVVSQDVDESEDSHNLNNCTLDVCGQFVDNSATLANEWITSVNSIFSDLGSWIAAGDNFSSSSSDNVYYNSAGPLPGDADSHVTGTYPFKSGASANYYLADNTFRNIGGSFFSDDMQNMTTYAPQDGSYPDNDGHPDLGYHYPVNEDSDYDGLPDWWEYYWFGNYSESGTNLDANGNTLLYDYTYGLDPNVIFFTLSVTNFYVNHTNAPVQVSLNGGIPAYYAVLVNDINQADATWQPYTSSNLTAGLGPTNGSYQVWIGLKGVATNATQTWEETTLTLDTAPPTITVTSPAPSVVSQPMVQVQGLVSEELSSLTFDVSNTLSVLTNQTGYVSESFFDTNLLSFSSNSFQLYDVLLTNGLNTITIHATDRAGNTSTTNFGVTLDYSGDTTPPAINVLWPGKGAQVSGGSFTIQATVDDLTAQVTASANGQSVQGQIQRNGYVRGLTLPLVASTNTVTVNATDAAGNSNTNSFYIVQSSVSLSISPLNSDQLNQSSVSVTGAVSDVTQIILVNGVQATVAGNSNWIATNVPVSAIGLATFTVEAYPPGSDPATATPDCGLQAFQRQPPAIRIDSYEQNFPEWIDGVLSYDTYNWMNGVGGDEIDTFNFLGGPGTYVLSTNWPGFFDEPLYLTRVIPEPLSGISYNNDPAFWTFGDYSDLHGIYDTVSEVDRFQNIPKVLLDDGGNGTAGEKQSYLVFALMEGFSDPSPLWMWTGLPLSDFTIQGQMLVPTGITNEDGAQWRATVVTVPAGTTPDVTPVAASPQVSAVPYHDWGPINNDGSGQYYQFKLMAQPITILANGIDLSTTKPEFCVGQQITFTLSGLPMSQVSNMIGAWTLPDTFVNEQVVYAPTPPPVPPICTNDIINTNLLLNTNITSCWFIDNPGSKHVNVNLSLLLNNGQLLTVARNGNFSLYKPTFSYTGLLNGAWFDGTTLWAQMSWNEMLNSKYDGQFGITQLIFGTGFYFSTDGEYVLDGDTEIYGNGGVNGPSQYVASNPSTHTIHFLDTPSAPATPCVTMDINFKDYFRFQPTNGIWVTIATNGWSVNASACVSTGASATNAPPAVIPISSHEIPLWEENRPE